MSSKHKPLPLSDTLRDLALLRASDLDLTSLLPAKSSDSSTPATQPNNANDPESESVDSVVVKSYEFAAEARKAIRLLNRGDIDNQGGKVENVRSQLEDILQGLKQ